MSRNALARIPLSGDVALAEPDIGPVGPDSVGRQCRAAGRPQPSRRERVQHRRRRSGQ